MRVASPGRPKAPEQWNDRTSRSTERRPGVRINAGTYRVGKDIAAGTYRGVAGADGCYWARLNRLDGSLEAIIANGVPESGQFFGEVRSTDIAFETDCRMELVE